MRLICGSVQVMEAHESDAELLRELLFLLSNLAQSPSLQVPTCGARPRKASRREEERGLVRTSMGSQHEGHRRGLRMAHLLSTGGPVRME